ncbi:hypothetical protein THAOC_37539, partial [Thalassiosira oceanica]
ELRALRGDGDEACANCGKARERRRQAQELHGLPPRQVLQRGLPEGPPQEAQGCMQEARGRAQGRAAVQSGAREVGGGLLPPLYACNTPSTAGICDDAILLREDAV